jgi:hypothetical protein
MTAPLQPSSLVAIKALHFQERNNQALAPTMRELGRIQGFRTSPIGSLKERG